jgi:hypothetical protein
MLKSILWIICMNASITIILARGIPDGRSVFIVKGELVFLGNDGNRLSNRGLPLSERGQPHGPERGSSCFSELGFPRVGSTCLLVSRLCASMLWGMID